MKPTELIPGYIYSDGNGKYRKHGRFRILDKIELERDGHWYAHYRHVGYLLIHDRLHFLTSGKCRLQTFANWAKFEYTEALFIEVKKAM